MEYYFTKKKEKATQGSLYFFIIFCFVIGAIIGNLCVKAFDEKAIVICSAMVMIAFVMMFVDREKKSIEMK